VMKGSDVQSYAGAPSTGSVTDTGREQAHRLSGAARERAMSQLDQAKGHLTSSLEQVANGLERACDDMQDAMAKKALQTAARFVRKTSDNLCQGSAEDIVRVVGDTARDRPGFVLAGLLGVGFLAGRLLRT